MVKDRERLSNLLKVTQHTERSNPLWLQSQQHIILPLNKPWNVRIYIIVIIIIRGEKPLTLRRMFTFWMTPAVDLLRENWEDKRGGENIPSEAISDNFDAHHSLSHGGKGSGDEVLIHVGLQLRKYKSRAVQVSTQAPHSRIRSPSLLSPGLGARCGQE